MALLSLSSLRATSPSMKPSPPISRTLPRFVRWLEAEGMDEHISHQVCRLVGPGLRVRGKSGNVAVLDASRSGATECFAFSQSSCLCSQFPRCFLQAFSALAVELSPVMPPICFGINRCSGVAPIRSTLPLGFHYTSSNQGDAISCCSLMVSAAVGLNVVLQAFKQLLELTPCRP